MRKRKPAFTDEMLKAADPFSMPGLRLELVDLAAVVSSAVGRCLSESNESRESIAAGISDLLGESVSKLMLDAYSSEARRDHAISFHRFLALIATTGRFDVLDGMMKQVGGRFLHGGSLKTFRIGELTVEKHLADKRLRDEFAQVFGRSDPI